LPVTKARVVPMRLMGHLVAVAEQGDSLWSVTRRDGLACSS